MIVLNGNKKAESLLVSSSLQLTKVSLDAMRINLLEWSLDAQSLLRISINIKSRDRVSSFAIRKAALTLLQKRQWFFQVGLSNPSGPPDARESLFLCGLATSRLPDRTHIRPRFYDNAISCARNARCMHPRVRLRIIRTSTHARVYVRSVKNVSI